MEKFTLDAISKQQTNKKSWEMSTSASELKQVSKTTYFTFIYLFSPCREMGPRTSFIWHPSWHFGE
jgi:hypothetical protein